MIGTSLLLLHLLLQLSPAGTSESSIIGGKKAKPHSRPYMVSLQVNGSHTCGGFLIREDFVLTAAHCFSLSPLTAVLGAENLKKKEKKSQQKIPVRKCYKHPMNDKSKYDFDIMLLKLQRNATLNKNVKVIQLPAKGETVPENTKCLMSGWGRKRPDETPPALLQEVTLMVLSNKDCKKIWQKHFVPNRMMCTRFDGKGICEGDSGGPLICKNKPHGIAAFTATPCNNKNYKAQVYMKVSYFIDWIKEKMSNS
ncbi:hypothetical protein SKAU_G00239950 [Synaphobranchus kaupii]|uniref:trypsin n=1 Tax=Synaphobranchus kaupii TaxID=118154 RepID=A0A9Q1F7C4_SYNKA|nr:hypothetical protein SKAU_G00239950 [Synaphobranchus kaupii]